MKFHTVKEHREFKELYESIYTPKEELTEEILDEVFNELVDELIEEGYEEEEVIDIIESATDEYIEEAKVTFGHDTTVRRDSGAPVGARRRYGMRKAGEALKGAKKAVKGAVAGAQIAGSIAKDEARRTGRKVAHSASKAADAVKRAPGEAKKKAKSGIKGFIKRQAQKVVNRMSEEIEALKATGKFSEKEIEAFMGAEMIDENRRAARSAGGYKDDSKKQPDPSKDGFTGVGNMSIDAIRKMSARIEKEKTKKEEVEAVGEGLTGERYKAALKKGKQYSRRVSADPAKRATRGGRGGESDFGAGDRGTGNRAARRAGTYED